MPRKIKSFSDRNLYSVKSDLASKTIPGDQDQKDAEEFLKSNGNGHLTEAEVLDLAFVTECIDKEGTSNWGSHPEGIGAAAGSISALMKQAIPTDRRKQVNRCYYHFESDDLLNDLVNLKIDFTLSGISLQAKPPIYTDAPESQEEISEFQNTLNEVTFGIDLEKITEDLLRDWFLTDTMILYWRTDPIDSQQTTLDSDSSVPEDDYLGGIPNVHDISALNPATVDWDNSLGLDSLFVDIPDAVKKRIQDAFTYAQRNHISESETTQKLIDSGIGLKWIEAVRAGKPQVELKPEDGDNWLIKTTKRKHHGLASPSMKTIFLSLELRKLLNEGEFSAGFVMKHFIMLIKQGESIENGPMAGNQKNWLKAADAKKLLSKFSTVNKAVRIAANHTTQVEFVYPPAEMFSEAKYKSCERRIFNWSGVVQVIMSGEESNYGGGFLSVKKMIAQMAKTRRKAGDLLKRFFYHKTIRGKIKTPEGYLVNTSFDTNVLKEPRQLLEEVKFLFESAISDQRSTARELERDPEQLKASSIQSRKENEQGVWEPIGGQAKYSNTNQGGRPPNNNTQVNEETRQQSPYGRTTENT